MKNLTIIIFLSLISWSVYGQDITLTSNPNRIDSVGTTVQEVRIDKGTFKRYNELRVSPILVVVRSGNSSTVRINTMNDTMTDCPEIVAGKYFWITVTDTFWIKFENQYDGVEIYW